MSEAAQPMPAAQGRMPSAVLGMILFVAMETMLFSGMIGAYIVMRNMNTVWPPMNAPRLNLATGAIATLIIVFSNLALAAAGWLGRPAGSTENPDAQARRRHRAHGAIFVALLLGLVFSLMQAQEWRLFLYQGLTGYGVDMIPAPEGGFFTLLRWHMGRSEYSAFFFMLTLTHALHLWAGMIILTVLALRGRLWEKVHRLGTQLEVTSWFWHFICVAWLFLYWLLYLQA
jgi:cytochrome c oxidase subunit 3